jgi:hypothetical protein
MVPISHIESSAWKRLRRWMARWNRPCAEPWLVIVPMPLGRRLTGFYGSDPQDNLGECAGGSLPNRPQSNAPGDLLTLSAGASPSRATPNRGRS